MTKDWQELQSFHPLEKVTNSCKIKTSEFFFIALHMPLWIFEGKKKLGVRSINLRPKNIYVWGYMIKRIRVGT